MCACLLRHPKKSNVFRKIRVTKESYSRVNESKQQLNSFIIYDLDSIARVNERKKEEEEKVKLTKM